MLEQRERARFEIPARGRLKELALNRRGLLRGDQGSFEDKVHSCDSYQYLHH
jgi:hypothetical protein